MDAEGSPIPPRTNLASPHWEYQEHRPGQQYELESLIKHYGSVYTHRRTHLSFSFAPLCPPFLHSPCAQQSWARQEPVSQSKNTALPSSDPSSTHLPSESSLLDHSIKWQPCSTIWHPVYTFSPLSSEQKVRTMSSDVFFGVSSTALVTYYVLNKMIISNNE